MCRELSIYLEEKGYQVSDFGTMSKESCDYPEYAVIAAKAVSDGVADFGVIICGSGQGMQMTANKIKGIRAAHCHTPEMAEISRKHNNANVVTFGARYIDINTAKKVVNTFLTTEFEGGRHIPRINKMHALTGL